MGDYEASSTHVRSPPPSMCLLNIPPGQERRLNSFFLLIKRCLSPPLHPWAQPGGGRPSLWRFRHGQTPNSLNNSAFGSSSGRKPLRPSLFFSTVKDTQWRRSDGLTGACCCVVESRGVRCAWPCALGALFAVFQTGFAALSAGQS